LAALKAAREAKNALKLVRICVAELPRYKPHLAKLADVYFHYHINQSTAARLLNEKTQQTRKKARHNESNSPLISS
jgi:hypothetical protein